MPSKSEKKLYCKVCDKFFNFDTAKTVYSRDFSQKRFLCSDCNEKLIRVCSICNSGKMLQPEIPELGDFDEEGVVESFCTSCGCGFIKIFGGKPTKFFISKRDIKTLIDKIFTRKGLPYNGKVKIEERVFSECKTRTQIIGYLTEKFGENENFLDSEISGSFVLF